MHVVVIRDVVSVVAIRRDEERLQPDAGHAESGEVVQPSHQPFEVAYAVAVGVLIFLDVEAVDDGVFVPEVVNRHRAETSNADAIAENLGFWLWDFYVTRLASRASTQRPSSCFRRIVNV